MSSICQGVVRPDVGASSGLLAADVSQPRALLLLGTATQAVSSKSKMLQVCSPNYTGLSI